MPRMKGTGQERTRTVSVTTGLRSRAWWVIRKHKAVTIPFILERIAHGNEKDADGNLGRWMKLLTRAGILSRDEKRAAGTALTSNGFYRYRLVRDLGRKAPVVRASVGVVYDPNSGETHPIAEEDHA